jgi:signal transduction histidine kinase
MDEILLNLRPKLKRTKHKINVVCEEDIVIESYPGAVSQVITNLVMNSLIHAYDEGDSGIMEIGITRSDNQMVIRYSDNGKGIPKENLDKIYDPFFTTKRGNGGTGLGLNIVYNIISQKLGGTITCESTQGEGTTFIISIPIEKGDTYGE